MKITSNIAIFILEILILNFIKIINAAVTLKYSENGVLRKDGQCDITFINFGIEGNITRLKVVIQDDSDGSSSDSSDSSDSEDDKKKRYYKIFDVKISGLINGNIGINKGTDITLKEMYKYIKISQNNKEITDFEINPETDSEELDHVNGLFNLKINNLSTCNGLTIKQVFKDELVVVNNRMYYMNKVPSKINTNFDKASFGPSYKYTYKTTHFKINEGFEELMKTCGIHMVYSSFYNSDKKNLHWQYFVSTENINSKNCSISEFGDILKKHYTDYDHTIKVFTEGYQPYVFKREGHEDVHMDGYISEDKNNSLIEMYEKGCNSNYGDHILCYIPGTNKLTFTEMTNAFIKNCLNIDLNENETPEWKIEDGVATGTVRNQELTIKIASKEQKGSLPANVNDEIIYVTSGKLVPVARFFVESKCINNSVMTEDCLCEKCPLNCKECSDKNTCTKCENEESSQLINGKCVVKSGYFSNADGIHTICPKECKTCDIDGCIECAGENTELDGKGSCKCKKGYDADDNGICKKVELTYSESGVLRNGGTCDITFINFGIKNNIENLKVEKITHNDGIFDILISGLINGNIGINKGTDITLEEMSTYIKVNQNNDVITDFVINPDSESEELDHVNGLFDLKIKNLLSCDGLIIKQVFKDELIVVNNRMYYMNQVPSKINAGFNRANFGPSYSYAYKTTHFKINEGFEELMKTCGIHMFYDTFYNKDKKNLHWQYFVSTENINSKNCSISEFADILKKHYSDYDHTIKVFTEDYQGYVFKREGHEDVHMDGYISEDKNNCLIEMYEKGCNSNYGDHILCYIPGTNKLTFTEMTDAFIKNCLNIDLNENETPEWKIEDGVATGTVRNQELTIKIASKEQKGSLPENVNDEIIYVADGKYLPVARFFVESKCINNSMMTEDCLCEKCALNCKECINKNTCTKCENEESSQLINGKCVVKSGYFENADGIHTICPKECKTCDIDGCIECAGENTELNGKGGCKCKKGYDADDNGICKKVELTYSESGVLRNGGTCDITFINFGIKNNIEKLEVNKIIKNDGIFDILISGLINGNIGINKGTDITLEEMSTYIKVNQNDNVITDFVINPDSESEELDHVNGLFDLKIKNLSTCDGLTIKQVFKDELIIVNNRMYYMNQVPSKINAGFNRVNFGPSYSYAYKTTHFKINEGFEELMKTCGIHMFYDTFYNKDKKNLHWQYFVSTENINSKNCSISEFADILKKHYSDYDHTIKVFTEDYQPYVFKREGHEDVHMDGFISEDKNNCLIEIYEKGCNSNYGDHILCYIPGTNKLTFTEMTNAFIKNCLNISLNENETPEWKIEDGVATGTVRNQELTIKIASKEQKGSLPENVNDEIIYVADGKYLPVARFFVESKCINNSVMTENCICEKCALNCKECINKNTCTKCENEEGSQLINGKCVVKPGYFENADGIHTICPKECKTCDIDGCIECIDGNKELDGKGSCKCKKGYDADDDGNCKKVELTYSESGVLRKGGNCDITFINFGIKNNIEKLEVNKIIQNDGSFDILISGLINGNIGINKGTDITLEEMSTYIKVNQNNKVITNFIINPDSESEELDHVNGLFDLKIKNLLSCDGLIIKQVFKDELIVVNNRMYYMNQVPSKINAGFNRANFGPSYSYAYKTTHFKINEGFEELMKTCGIHMFYDTFYNKDKKNLHWQYFVSTENINSKNCSISEFADILKKHYSDYDHTIKVFTEDYQPYVFKREGHEDVHMDGFISEDKNNCLIEMYEKGCNSNYGDHILCYIPGTNKLTFTEMTDAFIKNCLNISLNENETPEWKIEDGVATGTVRNQELTIKIASKEQKGSLPENVNDEIIYVADGKYLPIARFFVESKCINNTVMNENCLCEKCAINCKECINKNTCTKCENEESSQLINGKCVAKPGYFANADGIHTICSEECKTCDINGCTECADELKVLDGKGSCRCKDGYYLDDNNTCTNKVTLRYTERGVLRRNGICDINFINFGIKNNIENLKVEIIPRNENGENFDVKITGLINGNIGMNQGTDITLNEMKNYIKITQNNYEINDFKINPDSESEELDHINGLFDLKIYDLSTCDGLSIKQEFKENLVVVNNRLYHFNEFPIKINKGYDVKYFGPSYKYDYKTTHFRINEGLDEIRETCGIQMHYESFSTANDNVHWKYYISTENVNPNNCTNINFAEILKRNFDDYDYTLNVFGGNYHGYVFKREGHVDVHMDGLILDTDYTIEVYEKGYNSAIKDHIFCFVPSKKQLSFKEFSKKFIDKCLHISISDEKDLEYIIGNDKATVIINNQLYTFSKADKDVRGSLPDMIDGEITYLSTDNSIPFARLIVNNSCKSGYFLNSIYKCEACPLNCDTCKDKTTCTKCINEDGSELIDGKCVVKPGYYVNTNGIHTICPKDCKTCDIEGCIDCKSEFKELDGKGGCKCKIGYYLKDDNECEQCNYDCEECGNGGICKKCKNSSMIVDSENVCRCEKEKGYYLSDDNVCTNKVTLRYTDDGVLRRDGKCDITFVNFGIDKSISDRSVVKTVENDSEEFSVTIKGLINGNMGLNYETVFELDDLKEYIKISQNNVLLNDFEVSNMNSGSGTFDLKINKLTTCDGLIIKLTFKDELLVIDNRIYYENVIPTSINQAFDINKFGPDKNFNYPRVHWKINEGLDELRKICGIYTDYKNVETANHNHWRYYLSTENINKKECTTQQFSDIVKKNFEDFDKLTDIVGENFIIYVLKREGKIEAQTNGVIMDSKYVIEVHQTKCTKQDSLNLGSVRTSEPILFTEFTDQLVKKILKVSLKENEKVEWTISSDKKTANGKMLNQVIKLERIKGTFPDNIDGTINYDNSNDNISVAIAGFKVSFVCEKSTYIDDQCQCHACALNCKTCTDYKTCTECVDANRCKLVLGKCVCDASYFITADNEVIICEKDCETCDSDGCTSCKDEFKELDGKGGCQCKKGYYMGDNNECLPCNDDCEECGKNKKCSRCKNSSMIVDSENVCRCDDGYYLDDEGKCINKVTLKYTEEGVLRRDGKCHVTFVNFGIDKSISDRSVEKTVENDSEEFSVTIKGLVNGNMGLNYETIFELDDLKEHIKISQNNVLLNDFEVSNMNSGSGTFDLKINKLTTCDGLTIKQTFKDELLVIDNRIYYENVIPTSINQAFDMNKFGPDKNFNYPRVHWKINEGLDELRKTCGIYTDYKNVETANHNHWKYYLSTENINNKGCTTQQFSDIVKRNFEDFDKLTDIVGENFIIYVLKREGKSEAQTNGIITDSKYVIEILQTKCTKQDSLNLGSVRTSEPIIFRNFADQIINNILKVSLKENEKVEWTISSDKKTANGKMLNQVIKLESIKGTFPDNIDGTINYNNSNDDISIPIAGFKVSFICEKSTYIDDHCQCHACGLDCNTCTDNKTCTKCVDANRCELVRGKCVCDASYFINDDDEVVICEKDCKTCDSNGCTSCKDEFKELDGKGGCQCKKGYYMGDNNKCLPCNDDCEECGENKKCSRCKNSSMIVDSENVCRCDDGYYLDDEGICINKVTLKYTEEGVLRRDGKCHVTFVNFGISNTISERSVEKTVENDSEEFSVTIKGLVNGNMGLNYETVFELDDLKSFIKISQDNVLLNDFEVSNMNSGSGTFDLKINKLTTCDGLIIKQTFKDQSLIIDNRIYYENVIPTSINQAFDTSKFGPDNRYSYPRVHWKINEGLDELRKICGIYTDYKYVENANHNHWRYYLSTENINYKRCNTQQFSDIVKRNFEDFNKLIDIVGENFVIYVLKREGKIEAQTNGVIMDSKYVIEVHQNKCTKQNSLNLGSLRSSEPIFFRDFTDKLVNDILDISLKENEKVDWTISSDKKTANGKMLNQVIKLERIKGTFPDNIDGTINYDTPSGDYSTSLAGFSVSITCEKGYFSSEKCFCDACPINCVECSDNKTCTKCKENENCTLVLGQCVCNRSYFINTDDTLIICGEDCKSCNLSGCTECKDNLKELDGKGGCKCKIGYYMGDNNVCLPCNDDCEECGENKKCSRCKNSTMIVDSDNVCRCENGYYLNDDDICTNKVTLRYTEEGVLRRDGKCDITFVNFGISDSISSRTVTKTQDDNAESFAVTIYGLINGNIGLNYDTSFDINDFNNNLIISQNGQLITNYEVSSYSDKKGTFNLKINNLTTCDGLIIKQTFKDELLVIDNRIYYENVIPSSINQAFDTSKFGPDSNYYYPKVHWKINEGLDDLRKTCGIYTDYKYIENVNNNHWRYYLSIENINYKRCSTQQFSNIVKRNFEDFDKLIDIVGENFIIYVLKREGKPVAQTNGIINDTNYAVEILQNKCSKQDSLNLGSLLTSEPVSFNEFTNKLIKNMLKLQFKENENIEWTLSSDMKTANGKMNGQVIKLQSLKGTFPDSTDGIINYNKSEDIYTISLARISVSIECEKGYYSGEKCICDACSANCIKCTDNKTCTKCNENENCKLVLGQCVCNRSYFINTDDTLIICEEDCKSCDLSGCTECNDNLKELDGKGGCKCKKGYYLKDDNECEQCNYDCEECGNGGICKKCKNSSMIVDSENVCRCEKEKGYYLGDDNVCTNKVTLRYTEDGVLRRDGKCDITFVNFGIDKSISDRSVVKTVEDDSEEFSVTIKGLINGNMGLNYETIFELDDLKEYIKISQNNVLLNDFEVSNLSEDSGTFDLKINKLTSCYDLTIKQTFKDELLIIDNRIYYENVIPTSINQAFDINKFGPDKNFNYPRVHWKINEGLDELRKICGIYTDYKNVENTNHNHWKYYLSTENINKKECTTQQFSDIVKKNFEDFDKLTDIVGENFVIYVLKREGKSEAQTNGVIVDSKYAIEINQVKCSKQDSVSLGTLRTSEPILFTEFTDQLVKNILKVSLRENEKIEWTISSDKKTAKGKMFDQVLNLECSKGTFPENIDGTINYSSSEGVGTISLTRIKISFICEKSTYIDDHCQCHACGLDCNTCTDNKTCTKCVDANRCELVRGKCVCDASYFINDDDEVVICEKDCKTCDSNGCTSCKDEFKDLDGKGGCKCKKGYYMGDDNKCLPCNDDCEECGENKKCSRCKNSSMIVDSENVCRCDDGYYLDDEGICINTLTLKFTEEGVLRRDGKCHITYVNFGTDEHMKMQTITKTIDNNTGTFDVTIQKLVNGNIGINEGTTVTIEELHDLLKISQNNETITNYEITNADFINGYFDLKLNNLSTCDGLVIKQTFKEELLSVANRLYYYNVIPPVINKAFPSEHFGPSYNYPFKRIHWKINEGLDDLRKTCGIHLVYKGNSIVNTNTDHWQYYLSIESVNTNECTIQEFFEVIKRNYIDYQYTIDLLGESYIGYVLKREGHVEAHMDGVNVGVKYSVEIYQKSCNDQFNDQIICTIRSEEKLSFMSFTDKLISECLNMTLEEDDKPKWSINNSIAKGDMKNHYIKITKVDKNSDVRGALPETTDDDIIYKSFNDENISQVARFIIGFTCNDGTFETDDCRCKACSINCAICKDINTCAKCKNEESSKLVDGKCLCNPGYFTDVNGVHTICEKLCKTCDINGCITCIDENMELNNGECKCKKGYYLDKNNKCQQCNDDCEECGTNGICTRCKKNKMIVNSDNVCECQNGYYLNDDGVCINTVTIKYTDDGVLRRDGKCHITFVNFGTKEHIYNKEATKIFDEDNKTFDITISSLINGNIGINYNTNITVEELHDYIKINQNGNEINDFEITNTDYYNGLFDLKINNLSTCEGLIIKQTFKEDLLAVANRLYYYNKIPSEINKAFPSEHFGPSYSYPFKRIHWKINEGLDDLRLTCGIYIVFKDNAIFRHVKNTNHWQYYLSIESINTKGCSIPEYFEVIKRNYIDYQYTIDLLGESYISYVLKREGHVEAHMDGVNVDVKYSIEMYQKSCNIQYNDQIMCTIRSNEALSFNEFTTRLVNECLNVTLTEGNESKWTLENGVATGKLNNQILKLSLVDVQNDIRGSLPESSDDNINYHTFNNNEFTKIARFVITSSCSEGSFMNDQCICQYCPMNCKECTDSRTCLECINNESSVLINGRCMSKPGYFEDADGNHVICQEDCKTCDINGCLTCKDGLKERNSDGECKCKKGYYLNDKNECDLCSDDCEDCESKTVCLKCKNNRNLILNNENKTCECEEGFYKNNNQCVQCDSECITCDDKGCLTCAKENKELNDDKLCVCIPGFYANKDKNCVKCREPCDTCTEDRCITCLDTNKKANLNGECECKEGFYDDGNNGCLPCKDDCKSCTKSSCHDCRVNNKVDKGKNKCECKDGYYELEDGSCEKCNDECTTCNKDGCTGCAKDNKSLDGQGGCVCDPGYYLKENNSCGKCAGGCATCKDDVKCSTCEDPNKEPDNTGVCVCKKGFYEDGGKCYKCNDDCDECTKNKCTKCKVTNMEANTKNVCVCKDGYFNNGNNECEECDSDCITCDINGCLTCFDEKKKPIIPKREKLTLTTDLYEDVTSYNEIFMEEETTSAMTEETTTIMGETSLKRVCTCKDGYYADDNNECQGCSNNCAKCTDKGCTKCKNKLRKPNKKGICKCIDGYYPDGEHNCIKCDDGCKTCDDKGCLTCPRKNEEIQLENGKNVCKCKSGYFENAQKKCEKCDKECKECDINGCISCSDNKKEQINGVCQCIKGFYDDGYGNCIQCSEGCTECDINSCKSCSDINKKPDGIECVCFDGFYTNANNGCVRCVPGCDLCEENKCLECHDKNKKPGENGKCVCKEGFYEEEGNCIPCNDDCLECTKSKCTKCKGENKVADSNNVCQCIPGYYEDKITHKCEKCDDECDTCIDKNICTSCAKENKTHDSQGKCNCNPGFYLNENDSCSKCPTGCATCLSKDECLTCIDENKEPDDNNECKCIEGYFENENGKCEKCDKYNPECKTCKSANICETCNKPNKIAIDGKCVCDRGFYLNNGNCDHCGSECETCENGEGCTLCIDGKKIPDYKGKCVCKPHHYMSNDKSCIECTDDCIDCNEKGCSLCVDGRKEPVNGKCQCKAKFFDAGNNKCEECKSECATCENATTCKTCVDENKTVDEEGKCVCKEHFYDDGKGNCIECSSECKTCDKKGCLTCSDIKKKEKDGKCVCKEGFYTEDNGHCTGCSNECATCTKTGCTSCNDGDRIPTITGLCVCKPGLYDDNGTCKKCDTPCKTCEDGNTCTFCNDPNKTTDENHKCKCNPGYYDDGSELCKKCDDECETCDVNGCITCAKENKTAIQGECKCDEGYFEKDKKCEKCNTDCKSCNNKDTCTDCLSSDKELKEDGTCKCKSHFYTTSLGGCIECDDKCAECNANGCTSCADEDMVLDGEGSCKCKDGMYEDIITGKCISCDDECATCNADGCLSCKNNKILDGTHCKCDTHFYEKGDICVECDPSCATCDKDGCASCNNPRILIDHECNCATGYYEKNNECILCPDGCSKCDDGNVCLECTNKNRIPNDEGVCVCEPGFYENTITHVCEPCKTGCASCNNNNTCTSCKDPNAFISDGSCVCPNSYITSDGMCFKCDDNCAECNIDGCIACVDNSKTPDENGKC